MARVLHVQPGAAHGEQHAGTVGELWRYPVKSMLGSRVPEMLVTERGCLGDRAWALRDVASGRIASAKRFPRLLDFRATYAVEPTPESQGRIRIDTPDGRAQGRIRIDTPDGRAIAADDPAASAIISEILGHELRLESQPHADEKTGIDRRTVFGDVPVSEMKPDWTPETMPDYFQLNPAASSRSARCSCSRAARSPTSADCRAQRGRPTAAASGRTFTWTPAPDRSGSSRTSGPAARCASATTSCSRTSRRRCGA
jgi:hypothetical protein